MRKHAVSASSTTAQRRADQRRGQRNPVYGPWPLRPLRCPVCDRQRYSIRGEWNVCINPACGWTAQP